MTPEFAYRWHHLEPLSEPVALALPELRAFESLWAKQKGRLEQTGALAAFWERVARSWSIETGIIERIYDLNAGATQLLIEQGFEANLLQHSDTNTNPERLIEILNDHRAGLGMVMDLIGGTRELSPGWIKQLHTLLCRHQPSISAREQGPLARMVEIPFQHGVHKLLPNSPTLADGRVHEYCPPEHVASEMERMVALYAKLPQALPEVRSAWLHHAFTQIHPFQDGNGRVARALASLDFIAAGLFPLVVDRADRDTRYMPALRAADQGDLSPLVLFFGECQQRAVIQAISLAQDVLAQTHERAAAIEAARAKVLGRAERDGDQRKLMAKRIAQLADEAKRVFATVANEVERAVPGIKARTKRSDRQNAHYWTHQIVELAKRHHYWADTREVREWARLQLEDGGLTDLVVVLHFVGNPSPGSCMTAAFLEHREGKHDEMPRSTFTLLPQEPVLLAPDEDEQLQQRRFLRWLDEAVVVALAEWRKRL